MDKFINKIKNSKYYIAIKFLLLSSFMRLSVIDGDNKSSFKNNEIFSIATIFMILWSLCGAYLSIIDKIFPIINYKNNLGTSLLDIFSLGSFFITSLLLIFICILCFFIWASIQSYSFFVKKFKQKAYPPTLKYYFIKVSSSVTFILLITLSFSYSLLLTPFIEQTQMVTPFIEQTQNNQPTLLSSLIFIPILCYGYYNHKKIKIDNINFSTIFPNPIVRGIAKILPILIIFIIHFIMFGRFI